MYSPGHIFPDQISPWCIPFRKIVGVALRVLWGGPVNIVTMHLSGTIEPSPWLGTLLVKVLEFKVARF